MHVLPVCALVLQIPPADMHVQLTGYSGSSVGVNATGFSVLALVMIFNPAFALRKPGHAPVHLGEGQAVAESGWMDGWVITHCT